MRKSTRDVTTLSRPAHPSKPAPPFDPTHAGTSERIWAGALDRAPDWLPARQSLLVVSPHPDDEVLGVGGLMHMHAHSGQDVTVVSVTDGEAAYPDWTELARVRERELADALVVLGAGRIKVIRVRIPDGQVSEHRDALMTALIPLVVGMPTLIAPYECDGHPDHDATGAVCRDIARLYGLPLVRYPIWAWHHGTPADFGRARWGRFCLTPAARRAKRRAIRCFTSQLRPWGREPIIPRHVVPHFERRYEAVML
jgi:LmbE family N-acetylglucosaminyl deacetylase